MQNKKYCKGGKLPKKSGGGPINQVEEKSLGGILSDTATFAATGASVGGPWGAVAGAAVGLGKGIYTHVKENNEEAAQLQAEEMAAQRSQVEQYKANRTQQLLNPVMREYGGFIDYQKGQKHSGSNKGIPVDAQGNPSTTSGQPTVALTEKGEVTWVMPDGQAYTFSEELGTAKEARSIMNRYKIRLGEDFDGEDTLAQAGMLAELNRLREKNEALRPDVEEEPLEELQFGGDPDNTREGFLHMATMEDPLLLEPWMQRPLTSYSPSINAIAREGYSVPNQISTQQGFGTSSASASPPPAAPERDLSPNIRSSNIGQFQGITPAMELGLTPYNSVAGGNTQVNQTNLPEVATPNPIPQVDESVFNFNMDVPIQDFQPDINQASGVGNTGLRPYGRGRDYLATGLSAGIGAAANLALAFGRERPTELNPAFVGAETIDLGETRAALRSRADLAKSEARTLARKSGNTKPQQIAQSNLAGAAIERNLGEQQIAISAQEAQFNAQARAQASAQNAAAKNRADQFNLYRDDQFDRQTNAYLESAASNITGGLAEASRIRSGQNYLGALGARSGYQVVRDPKTGQPRLAPIPGFWKI